MLRHQWTVPHEESVECGARGDVLQRLLSQRLAELRSGRVLAIARPHAPLALLAAQTIVGPQGRMAPQQCWLDGPRALRQEWVPIPRRSPFAFAVPLDAEDG